MIQYLVLTSLVLFSLFYLTLDNFEPAYAAKTGSYNFCEVFPSFSECGGWRTTALSDNYWFCDYVYLENFCKNQPSPEKQLPLLSEDHCCRYLGEELELPTLVDTSQNFTSEQRVLLEQTKKTSFPAIIWTDRDHYNFVDKVTIYGKLDFKNISIEQNIQDLDFVQTGDLFDNSTVVDIQLNGRKILKEIPVNSHGWFSAFHFLNDRYHFSNQNNLLEVEYIITKGVIPPEGPQTHATYHFTTGDIAKNDDNFEMWIDDSMMPHKIRYGIILDNQQRFIELDRHNFVISRLVTPSGYVIPIASDFSALDLSVEYDGFLEYGRGTYEIQITYGDNIAKKSFTY